MAKGKSPGSDGLSAEFYLAFWESLGQDLVESLNYAFECGELTISQRRGIITLIPKKSKDKTVLDNWRPISLLNTDYKIATRAIALRISKILPDIIHSDQTGYVKKRFIGQNIRLISDVIERCQDSKIPGIALFLDFKKAFDSIEWSFLFKALETFGFGDMLVKWIKTFYANPQSCVTNNGFATPFFPLERGVRQGCPLSGILFVIGVELLASAIRSDKSIKGLSLDSKEFKLSQYADDTTCLVADTLSASNLFEKLDLFRQCSGLELNRSKTEALWLGSNKNRTDTPFGIRWPKVYVNALGICFTTDQNISYSKNLEPRLLSLEKCLNVWSSRDLTLYGKINIVKSLALSKLTFVATVLPIPDDFVKSVNKQIAKFIWSQKNPKIKKTTMIGEKKEGGLGMPDFDIINKSLKAAWAKRLSVPDCAMWKSLPLEYLRDVGGGFIFYCNFSLKTLPHLSGLPLFYKDVLNAWERIVGHTPGSKYEVENEIIWNNKFITIAGKSVFYRSWYEAGVKYIKDLITENGNLMTLNAFQHTFGIKTHFLQYLGLLNAIPTSWKKKLKSNFKENETYDCENRIIDLQNISSKILRNILTKKLFEKPTSVAKLEKAGFTVDEISHIYELPFKLTLDVRLSVFQFKINHNILYTKSRLFRDKITENDKCYLCSGSQTLVHLFVDCDFSKVFWSDFTSWWNCKNSMQIRLQQRDILYAFHPGKQSFLGINYCLLVARNYIYISAKNEDPFCFNSYLTFLKNRLGVDKKKIRDLVTL